MSKALHYFSRQEWILLIMSYFSIVVSFLIAPYFQAERSILSMVTSMVGVTGVVMISKGSYISHYVFIVFSALYSILSITTAYYGEAIIYTCVMIPIHIGSIISWKKNNIGNNHNEVAVQNISLKQTLVISAFFLLLTIPFYFLLELLSTDNLNLSTLSLSTSCLAAYLMLKRVPFFSFVFALDDIFLLLLWGSKLWLGEFQYVPTFINCMVLTINDCYSFLCWHTRSIREKI